MRLRIFLPFLLLPPVNNFVAAQNIISAATLRYEISVSGGSGKPASSGLEGATLTIFLRPFESSSEIATAAGRETTLYDSRKGKGAILKEYSGQKLMITFNRENWEQKNGDFRNLNFTTEPFDTVIAGYSVRRASAFPVRGGKLVVFYAPDLVLQNSDYNFAFPGLGGLPVMIRMDSGEAIFTYLLSKMDTNPIATSKFTLPQSGFRIMSYEENQKLTEEGKR